MIVTSVNIELLFQVVFLLKIHLYIKSFASGDANKVKEGIVTTYLKSEICQLSLITSLQIRNVANMIRTEL